jgi:hypothetical protein
MPQYKAHLTGGVATFASVYLIHTKLLAHNTYEPKTLGITFLFCLLGSLYPDIDTKSVAQRLFYSITGMLLGLTLLFSHWDIFVAVSMASFLPLLVRHRGITHAVSFVVLTPLCIYFVVCYTNPSLKYIAWHAYYYFVAGGLSHLVLDFGLMKLLRRGLF